MGQDLYLEESGDRKRRAGQLWLQQSDVVTENRDISNGSKVNLLTSEKEFRGCGFYAQQGFPAVKVISESKLEVNHDFFESRILSAISLREKIYEQNNCFRLVHSDADFLPGLIVDRYRDYLVVEFRHPAIEQNKETVLDVLKETINPRSIYARNDVVARENYGLAKNKGLLIGKEIPELVKIKNEPYEMVADLKSGQKTGAFLDQRGNSRYFRRYISGGHGLDCFCYSGKWGLSALEAGAETVTFVDQSEKALDLLRENLKLNNWKDKANIIQRDVFDYLEEKNRNDSTFDFVVLDPPGFARSKSNLKNAERGYKQINLKSMRMLKAEGILATNSCTAPMSRENFIRIVGDSAQDAHTACRILAERGQPPDHPWIPEISSTRYLKCLICEISLR